MTETSPIAAVCQIKSTLAAAADEEELAELRTSVGPTVVGVEFRVVEPATEDPLPWDGADERRAPGPRPVDRRQLLRRRAGRRVLHRRRLAAHGRRRHRRRGRLHPPGRPHQGPDQVGRRVDLLGRARERAHGPPEDQGGRRHRRARIPEVVGAPAGLRGARAGRGADRSTRCSTTSRPRWPSGSCPTTWCSSTRCPRRASASSRRRRCGSASPTTSCPAEPFRWSVARVGSPNCAKNAPPMVRFASHFPWSARPGSGASGLAGARR